MLPDLFGQVLIHTTYISFYVTRKGLSFCIVIALFSCVASTRIGIPFIDYRKGTERKLKINVLYYQGNSKRNLPNKKRNTFFHYSDNAEKTQNILSFVAIFADTSIATSKASLMAILTLFKMARCRVDDVCNGDGVLIMRFVLVSLAATTHPWVYLWLTGLMW